MQAWFNNPSFITAIFDFFRDVYAKHGLGVVLLVVGVVAVIAVCVAVARRPPTSPALVKARTTAGIVKSTRPWWCWRKRSVDDAVKLIKAVNDGDDSEHAPPPEQERDQAPDAGDNDPPSADTNGSEP